MILTAACWGFNFVITKSAAGGAPDQFQTFIYNVLRFTTASMLLFLTSFLKGHNPFIKKRSLGFIALLSFFGVFMYQILYMIGQTMTSSSNIGIIYGFSPLLILLVAVIARIEKPTVLMFVGVIMGFIGISMILFKGGALSVDIGSLLFFCALLCWAGYTVFSKRILETISPIVTTAWVLIFAAIYQLPLALWQFPRQSWTEVSCTNILFVILSALLSLYTGYTLLFYAISRMGPSRTGVYTNLTPVFTLIFAVLIRGEQILPVQIIGLTIIIIGIGITKIRKNSTVS